jgi:hypothetical protein
MATTISDSMYPSWRIGSALPDFGGLLALVWAIPLVGAPVAGAIAFAIWCVRLVTGGF